MAIVGKQTMKTAEKSRSMADSLRVSVMVESNIRSKTSNGSGGSGGSGGEVKDLLATSKSRNTCKWNWWFCLRGSHQGESLLHWRYGRRRIFTPSEKYWSRSRQETRTSAGRAHALLQVKENSRHCSISKNTVAAAVLERVPERNELGKIPLLFITQIFF